VDWVCEFGAQRNCTHAVGWWYLNAGSITPSVFPVGIGNGTIVVADEAGLREYLRRGYGNNGLDVLAAALLLADLNARLSDTAPPAPVAAAMAIADATLANCPPNNQTAWDAVRRAGRCAGVPLFAFAHNVDVMQGYTNGNAGGQLCPDIGKGHREL
jgi:hypothetical protein